jgi:hypothetical protein
MYSLMHLKPFRWHCTALRWGQMTLSALVVLDILLAVLLCMSASLLPGASVRVSDLLPALLVATVVTRCQSAATPPGLRDQASLVSHINFSLTHALCTISDHPSDSGHEMPCRSVNAHQRLEPKYLQVCSSARLPQSSLPAARDVICQVALACNRAKKDSGQAVNNRF